MDVIEDLAFVLPVTVLCDLLGVPRSDGAFFRPLADRPQPDWALGKPTVRILTRLPVTF